MQYSIVHTNQYIFQWSCSGVVVVGGAGCSPSPTPSCRNWYTRHYTKQKRNKEKVNVAKADIFGWFACMILTSAVAV